jgi:hypothetical protein
MSTASAIPRNERPLSLAERIKNCQARRQSRGVQLALLALQQKQLEDEEENEASKVESDCEFDSSDSEEELEVKPSVDREHKRLKSPFAHQDLVPRYNKRKHARTVPVKAQWALKQLRAQRNKRPVSRSPSPPSPYNGILHTSLHK